MLKGKVALVTGASRGIGRAIAKRLANDGALVAVHYGNRKSDAEETVQEIQSNGGSAFSINGNLKSLHGVESLYQSLDDKLQKHTGENKFDILVNNAGIGPGAFIEETTEDFFDQMISVNTKAPFFIIQQALSRLRDNSRIINISSAATRISLPDFIAYSMTKGAINTMTFTLAKQLGARGITVNAILPGFIKTDMNAELLSDPMMKRYATEISAFRRLGEVEDIADTAAFLASSDSRWVTGQLIDVSGGSCL
ncbi:SDR family oxidoreductase [Bacillus cereus group sp. N21]|uniref:SDR family oxidoreductase n=1 Tax=Bacillus cereus group sp. N21 TaxID=2794591 RepID=UPI0018F39F71|nr:SDR family oxidoreductase [Bacillus cereus group sp. N21]MBJ8027839.1 SDR family oxidoreductase [Bacillus cereus group sp. N21]